MAGLTELVKARVSPATKASLQLEMKRQGRSESNLVRLAVVEYLNRQGRGK